MHNNFILGLFYFIGKYTHIKRKRIKKIRLIANLRDIKQKIKTRRERQAQSEK